MDFAERLKAVRKKKGITQKQLADLLGIPYQGISQYERGIRRPKYQTIEKIAKALECEISDLLEPNEQATLSREMILDGLNGDSTTDQTLLRYFHRLNVDGKQVAIERVKELTEIPRYFEMLPLRKED